MRSAALMILILLLVGCSSQQESDNSLVGNWKAQWKTLPESFPGVEDVDFTMNGKVFFSEDSVTIMAYGYEGCIFSEDTLEHSLGWERSGDSLHLLNRDDIYGMSYMIKSMSNREVELVLMDDIFLTLSR